MLCYVILILLWGFIFFRWKAKSRCANLIWLLIKCGFKIDGGSWSILFRFSEDSTRHFASETSQFSIHYESFRSKFDNNSKIVHWIRKLISWIAEWRWRYQHSTHFKYCCGDLTAVECSTYNGTNELPTNNELEGNFRKNTNSHRKRFNETIDNFLVIWYSL